MPLTNSILAGARPPTPWWTLCSSPGMHLLDVGCGIGGPARHLAERGCQITGIDLTEEFVRVAESLTRMVKLGQKAQFRQASALKLPFDAGTFDGAYTIHVCMNIAHKARVFREVARVLKPGARFTIYDIMRSSDGPLNSQVPWARTSETSFVGTGGLSPGSAGRWISHRPLPRPHAIRARVYAANDGAERLWPADSRTSRADGRTDPGAAEEREYGYRVGSAEPGGDGRGSRVSRYAAQELRAWAVVVESRAGGPFKAKSGLIRDLRCPKHRVYCDVI